jgi:hypothetical protein
MLAILITVPFMILAVAVAVVPLIWTIAHHEEWQVANGYPATTPDLAAASDVDLDEELVWSTPSGPIEGDDWSANLHEVEAQLV